MFIRKGYVVAFIALSLALMAGGVIVAGSTLSGQLPKDASGQRLQNAQKLTFIDAAGTPVYSPKTSVGTTPQAFVVPTNAVNMIIRCDAAFRYGDNATLSGASTTTAYMIGGSGADTIYPVAGLNGSSVYVKAESGTVTVSFMFEMLQ